MKTAIIGYGVVGKAQAKFFQKAGIKPVICDPMVMLGASASKEDVNLCDFAFVCVPTPTAPDGSCDVGIVREVVTWCEAGIIVIRSTIAPGTTDDLKAKTGKRIVFSPEYLGETVGHPLVGQTDFAVLGGDAADTSEVVDLYARCTYAGMKYHLTTALCAELAKYMENAYYATKVAFCNEFFDIARTFGVDYNQLREAWLADPRIERDHTYVYPEDRGFGGKCLPKDVTAIVKAAESLGMDAQLLRTVMQTNTRRREHDGKYGLYSGLWPCQD